MIKKLFTIVLIVTGLISAQEEYKPWVKAEREMHAKTIELSKIQYPGDTKIDVTYYGLDISVTANPNYIIGAVIIDIKVDTTSIDDCFLDLQNALTVDSLLLNGVATSSYTHTSDKINLNLDRTYLENETFTVKVYYQGTPGSSGFGSFEFGYHGGTPIIWTLSEPYGAPDWFPCKDTPADKADSSDVWLTVADNLTGVSNGTLESVTNNGNGTKTYYWKNHYTIAHYLISLAITNYQQYDTYYHYGQNDSMVITHYVYPESFNSVKSYLDETDDMLEVFSDKFGMYPFITERYGHAEMEWGGAMEHQTCSSMGFWGIGVVSHELAHQWYGDMITCKDWHHIWLNEGFATYSEAVYLEAKSGQAAYNSQIADEMSYAKTATGSIWVQDITSVGQIFNGARSYAKGACVLHMLRGVVGDSSTFFNIIRTYSDDPNFKYGVATTENFQTIAESVYGQSLDYFFQEWIYGENYPKYTVNWSRNQISGNTYQVDLNVIQNINSNPAYFTMPIRVKVNTTLGDTVVTLFNNAQNQNFQFEVNGIPQTINFDYGNWILKDVLGITDSEILPIPAEFSLEQNYPNPFNPSTRIKYTLPSKEFVVLKIFNILGKEIASLVNTEQTAGTYELDFDAFNLNSGVYFYRIEAGSYVDTKKMLLVK
jgi:aminopeptidase N